jgi:alpha-1,2-mannosyltransferase
METQRAQLAIRIFLVAVCALIVLFALPRLGPLAGAGAVLLGVVAAVLVVRWVPEALAAGIRRRPVLAALWTLAALLALVQVGRLSAFMADHDRLWGSAVPDPKASEHMCMSAYVLAADLSRRGEPNLYDARFYPAFLGGIVVDTSIAGLQPYLQDPFEYPPPFLLLPRAAIGLSNDFMAMRTAWFVLQALGLLVVAVWLARWVGGRSGLLALLLLPLLLASMPTLLGLQFGQFHIATLLLSLVGMTLFAERRPGLGGALLGFAIVSKLFPGLLLVMLLARRRWRELGWTVGFCALYALLGLALLGWAPFQAFVTYQLPRIASGEAFAFFERDPLFISRNFAVSGIVTKLHHLGVPGMGHGLTSLVGWLYTLVLVWLAWRAGKGPTDRLTEVQAWLALLSLGALRSPLAPSAYVVISVLWLLTFLAGDIRGRWQWVVAFAAAWAAIMGPPPLEGAAEFITGLIGQGTAIGICLWVLLRRTALPVEDAVPVTSPLAAPSPA